MNVANGPGVLASLGFEESIARAKVKLKAIPDTEIKALCSRIHTLYGLAKDLAAASKIQLPEEDFWAYAASTSLLAPQEKQSNQHVLLAVLLQPI